MENLLRMGDLGTFNQNEKLSSNPYPQVPGNFSEEETEGSGSGVEGSWSKG